MANEPRRLLGGLLLAGLLGAACAARGLAASPARRVPMTPAIDDVLRAHTDAWMALPHVVGTGIGAWRGRPCLKVYTDQPAEDVRRRIPPTVDGFPVRIEPVGRIRALEPPLTSPE